jgi:hypothetical protein
VAAGISVHTGEAIGSVTHKEERVILHPAGGEVTVTDRHLAATAQGIYAAGV